MPAQLKMTRSLNLPDQGRLTLFQRAPELGPRILFFTGGTALKSLSQRIIDYTHNSIHILTPFDSGGSSAVIRRAFSMLAVGDIRNRIMALADTSIRGNPDIFQLFAHRLPKAEHQAVLRNKLEALMFKREGPMDSISNHMRHIIRSHFSVFYQNMPDDFDLRGACIGNLILTGGFLAFERHIDPVVYMFSKIVESRGDVCAVTNKNLHLLSELRDGTILAGQHRITGKEAAPITAPIQQICLTDSLEGSRPTTVHVREKVRRRILDAHMICYPMGSFYSSLIANLLPSGVGEAIASLARPKIYIPNLGHDPEQLGLGLADCVETLIRYLQNGCSQDLDNRDLLNFVLIDTKNGEYAGDSSDIQRIRRLGVQVIDVELVSSSSRPYIDPHLLLEHLLSFF